MVGVVYLGLALLSGWIVVNIILKRQSHSRGKTNLVAIDNCNSTIEVSRTPL